MPTVSLTKFRHHAPLSRKSKFLALALVPAYFMAAGLFVQPLPDIFRGIVTIIKEPDFLITDYMAIGGIGAAFMNAGLLTLICLFAVYKLDMEVDGHTITSLCLMFGFSLFGKNLMNIWAILMGIFLYARYHKTSITRYLYIGFYGTSLSPIITQVLLITDLPMLMRVALSILIGCIIGFVLPPLATHMHYAHQGYSLYNVGFSAGIIATIIVSIFRSFGIETKSRLIWSTGNNTLFAVLLLCLFFGFIVISLLTSEHPFAAYRRILRSYGISGTDYVKEEGLGPTLLNMGLNGIAVTALLLVIGADLNGPTIGCIFTVLGFSATGKHLRNILPIMLGVLLSSFFQTWSITDPSVVLALLLSTTLAPIAGEFGVVAGMVAGFLHCSVAMNIGIVYGGMNLYNNGFAGGIVAAFIVPVLRSVLSRRARAKGNLSL